MEEGRRVGLRGAKLRGMGGEKMAELGIFVAKTEEIGVGKVGLFMQRRDLGVDLGNGENLVPYGVQSGGNSCAFLR